MTYLNCVLYEIFKKRKKDERCCCNHVANKFSRLFIFYITSFNVQLGTTRLNYSLNM